MIPENVHIADLSAQLSEDGVGMVAPDPVLHEEMASALKYAESVGIDDAGIVVLPEALAQPADHRDIAQELLNGGDLNLVIVQSPGGGAAVAHSLSRAELEAAEASLFSGVDFSTGLRMFFDDLTSNAVPTVSFLAILVGLFLVGLAATAVKVKI
ncbi:MAG: hypothetical protein Q4D85_03170 [Corynebacterium sp.]|uniref:Rv1476 family membrane protein n=1 Tax=Corynebacterium sp. TaxID=1720 RepID=UPI0026DD409D|nr:DUF6676 family protein [Corynebacterium sp.]MDO5097733.1 hypothetical protein [Corynebacterium sp.]